MPHFCKATYHKSIGSRIKTKIQTDNEIYHPLVEWGHGKIKTARQLMGKILPVFMTGVHLHFFLIRRIDVVFI